MSKFMCSNASYVEDIIKPLKKAEITFFSFTRIFNNGNIIDLNNRPDMAMEFYFGKEKLYKEYIPERNPRIIGSNFFYLDNIKNNKAIEFLNTGCEIGHMCVLAEKHDEYFDIYNYGMNPQCINSFEKYNSNYHLLNMFPYYFKEKFNQTIVEFEKQPIFLSDSKPKMYNSQAEFYNILNIQRYFINRMNCYITNKQAECCFWLKRGKSPDELCKILNISIGTVRRHLEALRKAFKADHMYQLLYKLNLLCFI